MIPLKTWLDALPQQAGEILRAAVNVTIDSVQADSGSDSDSAASRVVVVGVGGVEPGLLSFSYDQAFCERVAVAALGQPASCCDEPDLGGALMSLTDLLMDGAVEATREDGRHGQVSPAVYCGPILGRGVAMSGASSSCLTLSTDAGVVNCHFVSQEHEARECEAQPGGGLRILVAAQSPLVCRMLVRAARGMGFDAVSAPDGISALTALEQIETDVVALDMRLGGLNGAACLRQIREIRPEARVVLISTDGQHEGLLASVVYGAFGFVMRPFDGRGFEKQLRRIAALRAERALPQSLPV